MEIHADKNDSASVVTTIDTPAIFLDAGLNNGNLLAKIPLIKWNVFDAKFLL